jgi:hypothetical protein
MLSAHRQKSLKVSGKNFYKIHMHSDTQRDVEITYAIYAWCRPDILPKDILPNGHFAERHFAERTFCRTDILPNGHFAEQATVVCI